MFALSLWGDHAMAAWHGGWGEGESKLGNNKKREIPPSPCLPPSPNLSPKGRGRLRYKKIYYRGEVGYGTRGSTT